MSTPIPTPTHFPLRGWLLTAVLLVQTSAVQAQLAPAPDDDLPPVTLETYVVSEAMARGFKAERVQMGAFRDVDLIDMPVTINVITREVLDSQAARGLFDALKNTAGVTRSQISGSTYDNLSIRGILVENRGNYRLNGSLPVINLVDISMENKERVEVLKGASGLYYGFVPPSGIINMVTKRAGLSPVTNLTFNLNSHGAYGSHLDLARRFGAANQVGLRLNLAASTEDIGIDNFDGDRRFVSLAADWSVSENLLLRFDIEHIDKDVPEQGAIALPAAVGGVITLPPRPANTRNFANNWQRYDANATNFLLRADYLISNQWTFLVEAGRAETNRDRLLGQILNVNFATGAGTFRVTYAPNLEYQNDNYRTEVFGRFLTGDIRHDVTFGATTNKRFQHTRNAGQRSFAQNYYNPFPIAEQGPPAARRSNISTIYDTGLYFFDRIAAFNERLQVTVGARSTNYKSKAPAGTYEVNNDLRPLASVVFRPTKRTGVYFSYLEGPEQGGSAPLTATNAGTILPPLVSTQLEAGAKIELFGGMLAQLSIFEIERPSNFLDSTNTFVANGLARYRGTELFISGEITSEISVIASAILLDAKQVNAANAITINRTPEGTPERTGSLFIEWRPSGAQRLAFSAGAYYQSFVPVNNANQAFLPGYTTYSAGASYRFKIGNQNYVARLNGDNITDKNAWSTAGANLLGVTFPRTYKFSLTASF